MEQDVGDFVLHPPSRDHHKAIDEALDRALDIVPLMIEGRAEAAMMKLHTRA
jgi:PTH1 family peptidyl-tRNA hydrolase